MPHIRAHHLAIPERLGTPLAPSHLPRKPKGAYILGNAKQFSPTRRGGSYRDPHRTHDETARAGCRRDRHPLGSSRTHKSSWPPLPAHKFQATDRLLAPASDHPIDSSQRIAELACRQARAAKVNNDATPIHLGMFLGNIGQDVVDGSACWRIDIPGTPSTSRSLVIPPDLVPTGSRRTTLPPRAARCCAAATSDADGFAADTRRDPKFGPAITPSPQLCTSTGVLPAIT